MCQSIAHPGCPRSEPGSETIFNTVPHDVIDYMPVTIKGVCLDAADRVLLCRNDRGDWELPGGRPARGEAFPRCLEREIREETGLTAHVTALVAAYPYQVLPERWVAVIVYGCETPHTASPVASSEHDRVAFMPVDGLVERELARGYRAAIDTWMRRRPAQ